MDWKTADPKQTDTRTAPSHEAKLAAAVVLRRMSGPTAKDPLSSAMNSFSKNITAHTMVGSLAKVDRRSHDDDDHVDLGVETARSP